MALGSQGMQASREVLPLPGVDVFLGHAAQEPSVAWNWVSVSLSDVLRECVTAISVFARACVRLPCTAGVADSRPYVPWGQGEQERLALRKKPKWQ